VKKDDKLRVTIKGRGSRGLLRTDSRKVQRVTDWDSLKKAFDDKATIVGRVTE